MFAFSKKSLDRLSECDNRIIEVMNKAIRVSKIDFGILCGYRSPEVQYELYKKGRQYVDGHWEVVSRSKIVTTKDGKTKMSKHNYLPSRAVDIIAYKNGTLTYEDNYYVYLAGVIQSITEIPLRWGGNWDSDQELLTDQSVQDLMHFEL